MAIINRPQRIFLALVLLLLVLSGCAYKRLYADATIAYDSGDYDNAVYKGVEALKDKPDYPEAIALLKNAAPLAYERHIKKAAGFEERGNHEDFVISMFSGNQDPRERDLWLNDNGGRLTKASYNRAGCYMNAHQEFYETLPHSYETDDYFFCHAGVRPGVPLNRQKRSDLLEIREPFLSAHVDYGKVVVHGHTIIDRPDIRENRINIDTGACIHGPLTAMELPSMKIWQQV